MPVKLFVSFFDRYLGPKILIDLSSNASESDKNTVIKLFDLDLDSPYFEFKQDNELFINMKIEIASNKARGGFELMLISVVLTDENSFFNWKKELGSVCEQIGLIPHLSEIFTPELEKNPVIQMKLSKIERYLRQTINNFNEFKEAHPFGQLLFLGIEAVGKTSIIDRLKSGSFSPKMRPTLGTQILRAAIEHFQFQIFDVGGQRAIRQTWFTACKNPDAIVYVIDVSSSESRDIEFRDEFLRTINHYFASSLTNQKKVPILILLNKCDLIDIEKKDFLIHRFSKILDLPNLPNPHAMDLISAKENIGIISAFQWLMSQILIE